ncbi:hypothetical protein [Thomasclavelia cocleata]|uniref:hypothetical protein n=1 Tax=Thomasclavelia cocleata TaxID=69824 RepID=UPI00256F21D5|nr:hypothetical protein [Thomasclavelia cocleata]
MLHLSIKCPECGEICDYVLKTPGRDVFCIGDVLGDTSISLFRDYSKKCACCHKLFFIYELIENGRLVNILLNPSNEEVKDIQKDIFKTLKNYPDYYKPSYIKSVLYGPNTQIIPSQYSTDFLLNIGQEISFFDILWKVKASYKILDNKDNLNARIYKLTSEYFGDRLLVLRDDYLPELKEVNWDNEVPTSKLEVLKRYIIPKNCKLVICCS